MEFVQAQNNPAPDEAMIHWIKGEGDVRFRVLTAPAPGGAARGSVIVCPGRTEFIEKYFEVARDLQERGFAVCIIDWRGQGLADRELRNRLKGHFKHFDDAAKDLGSAVRALEPGLPAPRVLLAHSMGGAIALRALQLQTVAASAAAFSSPMWGLKLPAGGRSLAATMAALGMKDSFAPGVDQVWKPEDWRASTVTQDQMRHDRNTALIEAEPQLALAGPTIGWVAQALTVTDGFAKRNALSRVTIPVFVAMAGREMLVDNRRIEAVAKALPNAKLITITESKHEILQERDDIRAEFWAAFDAFVAPIAPAKS